MKKLNRGLFFVSLLPALGFILGACGVKGKPLPPDTPPFIGKGYPKAEDKPEETGLKKRKPTIPEDDFKEPADFGPESE